MTPRACAECGNGVGDERFIAPDGLTGWCWDCGQTVALVLDVPDDPA